MLSKFDLKFHSKTKCNFKCKNWRTCDRYTTWKFYEPDFVFAVDPREEDGKCYYHSLLGSFEK